MRSKSILVAVVVLMASGVSQAVTIDFVTIGSAGNAADTQVMNDGTTGYGAVGYEYQIGKYEVTAGQYCEFLNTVAATDTHGLYSMNMDSSSGITRHDSSGSYTYSVASDYANRPVNYVSWYDTLRFSNWLHNGQGTGDTENGAYDMSLGSSVVRKSAATVWLPSENEWYKAAYYTGSGYSTYANGTDVAPIAGVDTYYSQPPDGTIPWNVGTGTIEQNGTFDIMGNVYEWNETLIGSERGVRGGAWYVGSPLYLSSSNRLDAYPFNPDQGYDTVGFRVASVPEPATLLLLGLGAVVLRKRR